MVQIINGDLLGVTEGVIAHQVNLMGVMGAGLAASIKKKYPIVFERYSQLCSSGKAELGDTQAIPIHESRTLWVANLFAQKKYGRDHRYTDYDTLATCLTTLQTKWSEHPLYLPYGLGCGLAGGDWDIVLPLIEMVCPRAIIVKKD